MSDWQDYREPTRYYCEASTPVEAAHSKIVPNIGSLTPDGMAVTQITATMLKPKMWQVDVKYERLDLWNGDGI